MARKAATPKELFFQRIDDLVEKDQWEAIEEETSAFIETDGPCAEASYLLALAALRHNDFATAVVHAKQAFDADSGVTEYCDLLGTVHGLAGDVNSASFFAKMASVAASSPRLSGWRPKSLPTFTQAFFEARSKPFFEEATRALSEGRWSQAEHWFGQHLAFHPRDAEAHVGLANALMIQGIYGAAVENLRAARHALPAEPRLASLLGSALTAMGQFPEARAVHRSAKAMGAADAAVHAAAVRDMLDDPAAEPDAIAAEIGGWAQRFGVAPDSLPPRRATASSRRLTVGYVVGVLNRSGVSHALADILAKHDAGRFRIVGFGSGRLSDSFNIVFQKCFESWIDTKDADPLTFASMIRAEDVDVLVDVSGLTSPDLFRAFNARTAPVQAIWSPVLYGPGPQNVDVLLTDGFLDPPGRGPGLVGENLCRLDMGSLLVSPVPSAAADAPGAAERGPMFATDATLAEINIPTVEAWAEILAAVPESTLLLRDHHFRGKDAAKRLIDLFGNFGIAHRIDVIWTSEPAEFFAQADVCLLPYQSMRPQVAIDALAAGLPVMSWSGTGRHRRIVGSVLHYAGLAGDMVAESSEDYREKAVAWMNDSGRRDAFRQAVGDRLAKAPIFDAAGRAADLERAYLELHETVAAAVGSA